MTTTVDAAVGTTTDPLAETEVRLVTRWTAAGVPAEQVHHLVADARERLAGARISAFLPILVERAVRNALAP